MPDRPDSPVVERVSVLSIAADLARSSYDERIPDDVANEMRRKALLLRNEYDKGRRTERLGRSLHRVVKVCPDCGTACPSCARPSDFDEPVVRRAGIESDRTNGGHDA